MRPCRRIVGFILLVTLALAAAAAFGQEPENAGGGQDSTQSAGSDGAASDKSSLKPSAPVDYSKEAVVIEQAHVRYRFENDGTGREEKTFRVRIQSEAGVQQWGQLRFGYNSANETLEIPYVRVIKPDGSVVKAGADAVQDLSAPVQQIAPVYTDYREKHVTVPGLRPGDVLESESVTVIRTPLAAGQFWTQYDFNQSNIVLDEQLEIDIPGNRAVKLKTKPGMDPKITEEKDRKIYRWTSAHLQSEEDTEQEKGSDKQKDKPKKKKKKDELPAVQLTTFGTWEEVGRWYAGLEKDRRQPTKEVRVQADALTKGLKSDLEKAEALYDYVSTNFRYVSLSLGMARYQPHAAADVLHDQYGDCKDKHTLLAALLEAEGMHASAVLINTYRKLDPDVPSPAQFNHVITLLPLGKDEIWMDTTTEVAPFRLLSYPIRKKQGLVVVQEGASHLQETPADPPMQDSELIEVEGKVGESGKLDGQVRFTFRGDTELTFRMLLRRLPASQWTKFGEDLNRRLGLGGDASGLKMTDAASTREPFVLSYDVSKPNFLDWSKKTIDLRLPLSRFDMAQASAGIEEESDDPDTGSPEPFKIGAPNERTYRLKLELASRYSAKLPVPVNLQRDYGEYQSSYKIEGNVFSAERKLVTHVGELPPARADDYRAFRRSVLADAAQSLTIESTLADTRTAPADMSASELARRGEDARKEGDYGRAVALLNRAVEAEPKSKSAWNTLGLAYYDSGEDALAINAFQKEIEIDPFHQYAYNNLGRVYLRQRKYDEAEKWFRKQLDINPLDKYAHANLGRAYLDWHKYEQAVPELTQATSITPNDAELQVRLGQAYLNLGQDDKAMAAFDKAVQISASAGVWNNIAYELTLKNAHLDVAQRYAESALSSVAASLRNLSLDQLKRRDARETTSLATYWDTLGWVEFANGNLDKALKYVLAAWQLSLTTDTADHAGQIYAKRGDRQKAEYFYGVALNANRPLPETRGRLAELLGGDGKVDAVIEKYRTELQQLRTVKPGSVKHNGDGAAEFFVLLGARTGANASVAGVKFISGDETFKDAADALRAASYQQSFPDDTPVMILRRGKLSCKATECTFLLTLPEDVNSVE